MGSFCSTRDSIITDDFEINSYKKQRKELIKKFNHNQFLKKLYLKNNNDFKKYKNNIKYLADTIKKLSIKENFDYYQCLSCILGAFYGDALGNNVEFEPKNENNHKLIYGENKYNIQPGEITDDSEMAISLSFAILDNGNLYELNQNLLYFYYGAWYTTNNPNIGISTKKALQNFSFDKCSIEDKNLFSDKLKDRINKENKDTKANGFLMRISTLVVWFFFRFKIYIKNVLNKNDSDEFYELYKKIHEQVSIDTSITHPNKENSIACAIFVFMSLSAILKNNNIIIIEQLKTLLNNKNFLNQSNNTDFINVKNLILNSLTNFEDKNFDKNKFFDTTNKQGYYGHAFKLTLYYLFIFKNIPETTEITKYRYIINEICDFGGDVDTNCAIVGTVLGPLIGYNNFDKKDFDTFIYHINEDKSRILFAASYMYLYIKYLDISNKEKKIVLNELRYNVYNLFIILLSSEINEEIIDKMFN